ncbi:MAG: transcriptional repressor [Planctomycetota bacterium]
MQPQSPDYLAALERHGIRPSAQRLAIATFVLGTEEHPSAELVWSRVRAVFPMVSRATVYNTLQLFVEKGLLRALTLAEGCTVYDPNVLPHHHFLDTASGGIRDVPWTALTVAGVGELAAAEDLEVEAFSVVLRGRRRGGSPDPSPQPKESQS